MSHETTQQHKLFIYLMYYFKTEHKVQKNKKTTINNNKNV